MEQLTPIYDIANEFSENTARSLFLTGKAGTGKTTFLKNFRRRTRKQMAVVAPTGVAAINAGGVTIHSFFQLPFTPFVPTDAGRKNLIKKIKMTNVRRKVMQQLEILVIDEISMVRADLLDAVDTVLRHFRYRNDVPFGGVQVIYIGDLYQLPPVVVPEEWELISQYYKSPFFFDSYAVQQQPPVYIELDKIFRQSNADFVQLLNEVRNNKLTEKGFRMLQSRFNPGFKLAEHPEFIFLTTHNATANRINKEEMDKLEGETFQYEATIQGEFPEKNYPNDPVLELKEGAKVMFIANDSSYPRRYFNGRIGIVTHLDVNHVFVHCDDDEDDIAVSKEIWENIRYGVNRETGQIEENELGCYIHFPLRLAWAITIHKSQGLTFDKAVIDAAMAFSSGQVYVALSRCRSLEGIVLTSPIRRDSLITEPSVVAYSSNKPTTEQLNNQLVTDREKYEIQLIKDVFDFHFAKGQSNQLQNLTKKNSDLFNPEGIEHAKMLQKDIQELSSIGERFQKQIELLYHDEVKLCERLAAAADYFAEQIDDLSERCCHSPAAIFDIDISKEYKEGLKNLFNELELKKHLISNICENHTTEGYYLIKKRFRIPGFHFKVKDIFETENERPTKKNKKTKTEKKSKKPSHIITLEMYQNGKNIEEISEERQLSINTIGQHLTRCVGMNLLDIHDFVDQEIVEEIRRMASLGGNVGDIFSAFEGNIDYMQIRMALAGYPVTKQDDTEKNDN